MRGTEASTLKSVNILKGMFFLNLGHISIAAPPLNPQPSQTRLGELKVKARAENTNSSKSSNQNEV